MATIYTPEQTATILGAIQSLMLANNGRTYVGRCEVLADGLRAAGFTVVAGNDLHGNPTNVAFTPNAWAIHAAEAIDAYRKARAALLEPHERIDFEARILARNDRHLFA